MLKFPPKFSNNLYIESTSPIIIRLFSREFFDFFWRYALATYLEKVSDVKNKNGWINPMDFGVYGNWKKNKNYKKAFELKPNPIK